MFSECLRTALESFARILLFDFVALLMSTKPGSGCKSLVAVGDRTGIISLVRVGAFDVMLQMRVSKESFPAISTFEGSLVGM